MCQKEKKTPRRGPYNNGRNGYVYAGSSQISTAEEHWEEPGPDRRCVFCGVVLEEGDGIDFCRERLEGGSCRGS